MIYSAVALQHKGCYKNLSEIRVPLYLHFNFSPKYLFLSYIDDYIVCSSYFLTQHISVPKQALIVSITARKIFLGHPQQQAGLAAAVAQ